MNSNSDSLPLVLWGFDILATRVAFEATKQPLCCIREERGKRTGGIRRKILHPDRCLEGETTQRALVNQAEKVDWFWWWAGGRWWWVQARTWATGAPLRSWTLNWLG